MAASIGMMFASGKRAEEIVDTHFRRYSAAIIGRSARARAASMHRYQDARAIIDEAAAQAMFSSALVAVCTSMSDRTSGNLVVRPLTYSERHRQLSPLESITMQMIAHQRPRLAEDDERITRLSSRSTSYRGQHVQTALQTSINCRSG